MSLSEMPMTSKSAASLEAAVAKLEDVLHDENTKLESSTTYDHAPDILRKNQILRELMMLQKAQDHKTATATMTDRLRGLRQLVNRNHGLLEAQVKAMTEITDIITNVALSESADGTYSRNQLGD